MRLPGVQGLGWLQKTISFLFLLASHGGENLIQIFTKLLSRDRPDEIQLGAAKWLVFHHSKFLLEDPVVSDNSRHFSAPLQVFCKMTSDEWRHIFNTDDAALPGLVSDRSCESGGHYHMHTAGTIGPCSYSSHLRGTKLLFWRGKVALGQDKKKDIHYFKWNFLCLSCPSSTFLPGGGTPIHYLYGYVPPNGVVIVKLLI